MGQYELSQMPDEFVIGAEKHLQDKYTSELSTNGPNDHLYAIADSIHDCYRTLEERGYRMQDDFSWRR